MSANAERIPSALAGTGDALGTGYHAPKDLRLVSLVLRNFQGARNVTFQPGGANASVFGANGAGKTTLANAFTWLLFGKDSLGQTEFQIKTLAEGGEAAHNLDHSVEAVLSLDGRTITFRRTYREVWTKHKGDPIATFTGHETSYQIDGVPATKRDYEERIREIADEGAFRLLTSSTYFNEGLHWEARRRILLEVVGDLTDEQVIASDAALAELPAILGSRSLDNHRKVLAARKSEINKELTAIPTRIDEVAIGLPSIDGIKPAALDGDIANLRREIEGLRQRRSQVAIGGAVAEKRITLQEVEAELLRARNEHAQKQDDRVAALRKSRGEVEERLQGLRSELADLRASRSRQDAVLLGATAERSAKLAEWARINGETFTHEDAASCPSCGQALPAGKIQSAHDDALAAFNIEHAERLERNVREGTAIREARDKATAEVEHIDARIAQLDPQIEPAQAEADRLQNEAARLAGVVTLPLDDPAYHANVLRRNALQVEIARIEQGEDLTEALAAIDAEIYMLESSVPPLEAAKARVEARKSGEARIADLEEKQKAYAAEFEALEREMFLSDLFTRTKVGLLEGRINAHFKVARFRLFNTLVNGALDPVCETTVWGVPYESLNHGSRIQAGLDIIRTLQEHYGLRAPVFVDNRESVTDIPSMDCQVVSLYVSSGDSSLRVERAGE